MSKIYTRTGDRGETGLSGGRRVKKSHPRVRAYGEVDELNCAVGAALASLPSARSFAPLRRTLEATQEQLFVLGALLATPPEQLSRLSPPFDRGLDPGAVRSLETEIDRLSAGLEPLRRFILPGGSAPGAWLHLARTVCRRAERGAVALGESEPLPEGAVTYLNRLSDYLFTAARWVNKRLRRAETQWRGLAGG